MAVEQVSYSKFCKFNMCPRLYYLTYIAPFEEETTTVDFFPDTKDAMIGTYIQLCFESVINKKLFQTDYKNRAYISDSLLAEIKRDITTLMDLNLTYNGKKYKKDPKEMSVLFNSDNIFNTNTKINKERISDQIVNTFVRNFEKLSYDYDLSKCVCEVAVRKETDSVLFKGFVDFLITDGDKTLILDGKLNKNLNTSSPEQLKFYAWGLELEKADVGFINYVQSKTKIWTNIRTFDVLDMLEGFKKDLNYAKKKGFKRTPFQYGCVKGHCKWCPEQEICNLVSDEIDKVEIEDNNIGDVAEFL